MEQEERSTRMVHENTINMKCKKGKKVKYLFFLYNLFNSYFQYFLEYFDLDFLEYLDFDFLEYLDFVFLPPLDGIIHLSCRRLYRPFSSSRCLIVIYTPDV